MIKKAILSILGVLLFAVTYAQDNVWIKGVVTDNKMQPIYGASVYIKGTLFGIRTDIKGEYELPIPKYYLPAVVVFKATNFEQQEYSVDGNMASIDVNIQFASSNVVIQEVVVTASKRAEKIVDAPASISILTEEKIKRNPYISPADQIKKLPGVDNIQVNLVVNNLSIRGFNQLFTQSALAIIDNRLISLPSLRFNAYQLIPNNISDFKRIELVRGPASALYGPNASYGVINIITKSPLDQKSDIEGSVSMTAGLRSIAKTPDPGLTGPIATDLVDRLLLQPEMRLSYKLSEKVGLKLSMTWMPKGLDYEHYEPLEPRTGIDKVNYGSYLRGDQFQVDSISTFNKNFELKKFSGDFRFDYKISKKVLWIVNGGYSQATNLGISPLGTSQSENFKYAYGQTRLNINSFFFQTYLNYNDAGNSFIIPRDNQLNAHLLKDKSYQLVSQIQNSSKVGKFFFVYGSDYSFTSPNTDSTIFGRNEGIAKIHQIGAYLQAEYKPTDKLTLLAALRGDYQNNPEEIMLSPRGAIVYKPNMHHAIRLTYNRAFNTPSMINLFSDIFERSLGNGINVRLVGNNRGFDYNYDNNGNLQFGRPSSPDLYTVDQKSDNSTHLKSLTNLILEDLNSDKKFPDPNQVFPAYLNKLMTNIDGATINKVDKLAVDYLAYDKNGFTNQEAAKANLSNVTNLKTLRSTVTQTFELGYKFIQNTSYSLGIDLYYSIRNNFLSTSTSATYNVIFDNAQFESALRTHLRENVDSTIAAGADLVKLFDQNPNWGGNSNGDPFDEILNAYLNKNKRQTLGTITPSANNFGIVGNDIILTPVNVGTADIFGTDVYMSVYPNKNFEIAGNFSFINKDKIVFSQAANGYVALNAPKYKSLISFEHFISGRADNQTGLSYKISWRWQDAFPAFSTIWVGDVVAANFIDFNVNYTPKPLKNLTLTFSMSNVLDNLFQGFPGTAHIGRVSLLKLQYNFSSSLK